ncbi:MAG: nicotinate phosphoribosyltransferase [Planctomycetota bacterium]
MRSLPDVFAGGLFTDLYELTMAQAYHAQGMNDTAVFELFFRKLPEHRTYTVAAGLDDALAFLEALRFTDDDLAYLAAQGQFHDAFLDVLRDLRFTGDVWAMPEGTVVFPDEPILQVVAPILQAQLVETAMLNQINVQSVLATKAARVVHAARGRTVVDFGSRRAHGAEAAIKAARCGYLAGAQGTSNVLAGRMYDIPIVGTMAHSYIQAHDDETAAFEHFARLYPGTTLLVDTYDTLDGVRKVIDLAASMGDEFTVRAVRLDSGDLTDLARRARAMLDEAGLTGVKIFASSGLDEYKIDRLLTAGAPIDGFGVGTSMVISDDAVSLDLAYKLVAYAGRPRTKLSSGKLIYPGRKQVFRITTDDRMDHDTIAFADDSPAGDPLLVPVMRRGQRTGAGRATLAQARETFSHNRRHLPDRLTALDPGDAAYPVHISQGVQETLASLREELEATTPSRRG